MPHRCAILDDYQNVALKLADWSPLKGEVDVRVYNESLGDQANVIRTLKDCSIVCLMRERTLFPRAVFEGLPELKLVVTSGARNAAIDLAAAEERKVLVCGTAAPGNPTAELAIGLMLELARKIGYENAQLKAGARWQTTLGLDLGGKTLGCVGLGKLGAKTAQIGRAIGMDVIAWSQNLTAERCREVGASLVSKEDLFRLADFITVHLQLSPRTRGLICAADLALMKPAPYFINTSRGPIVDEKALIAALTDGRLGGAGLDVFDTEPLPVDHPFRKLDNVVLTPHLGYVSVQNYKLYYPDIVVNIRDFIDGKPFKEIATR